MKYRIVGTHCQPGGLPYDYLGRLNIYVINTLTKVDTTYNSELSALSLNHKDINHALEAMHAGKKPSMRPQCFSLQSIGARLMHAVTQRQIYK